MYLLIMEVRFGARTRVEPGVRVQERAQELGAKKALLSITAFGGILISLLLIKLTNGVF